MDILFGSLVIEFLVFGRRVEASAFCPLPFALFLNLPFHFIPFNKLPIPFFHQTLLIIDRHLST